MASERRSVLASSSFPTVNDTSYQWEEDYRRRARLMTRDYVNPNSTRLTHQRRSRSADSRPQYNTPSTQRRYDETLYFSGNTSDLANHRAQCLNVFYPTNDETRARVMYDTQGPEFPSQLPKPIGRYEMAGQGAVGQSLSTTSSSGGRGRDASRTSMTSSGMVDPYGGFSQNSRTTASQLQSLSSVPATPKRHDYHHLKNSLIMFGDEEAASISTGLSQQELLERRRREQTTARRKEKKQRKRIVNLPSSLFPPHSSRQRQHPDSSRDLGQQDNFHHDYEPPSLNLSHQVAPTASSPVNQFSAWVIPQEREGLPRMVSPDPPPEHPHENLPSSKGSRGAMVNRIKNEKRSSARRWKVIPSLSRPQSTSHSPVRHIRSADEIETGAFPSPARMGASMRHGDSSKKQSTTNILDKPIDSVGHDNSNEINQMPNSPKRALDPPSRAVILQNYSNDGDEWSDGLGQPVRMINETKGTIQQGNSSDYGRQEQWEDRRVPASRSLDGPYNSNGTAWRHEYVQDGNDGSHSNPLSRQYKRSNAVQSTPRKHGQVEAFPDPPVPLTPLTASMTIDSNDMSYEFDPFTTPMTPDAVFLENASSKRSQEFSSFEDGFWKNHTEEPRSADPLVAAMSRLNNPPGLDMDFYSRPRPDAPATASSTPNSKRRQSKPLPTSAIDFNLSVRWSENLDQLPTPSRAMTERPKSILRSSRLRLGSKGTDHRSVKTPTMSKSVRISDKPASRGQFISQHPSAMGFVDNNGRALSPITSFETEYGDSGWPSNAATPLFERNIPEEFQRAFLTQNLVSRTDDHSGQMTAAYSDFIESVASVVVQTAARQFLAKLRVQKVRRSSYASRDRSGGARTLKTAVAEKTHYLSTLSHSGVHLDMFTLAAIRIQAVYRGWYARDCIAIDNYCATIIQKNFRRKIASDSFAALVSRNKASLEMIYNMAATIIQSQWRCFKCEMDFLRAYEDILLVQSIARGWVARHRIRSWMRKHGIQTSRSLNESINNSYSLPHGYHNHTAFMKQNLPSPVRTSHAMKLQEQGTETLSNISIDVSEDGLVEIYHQLQDGRNSNEEDHSAKNMTQKKKATTPQSVLHGGGLVFTPAKNNRPIVNDFCSLDPVTKKAVATRSERVPDSKTDGGVVSPPDLQIDSTPLPTASSILAGWRGRAKNGKFDSASTSASSRSAARGTEEVANDPEPNFDHDGENSGPIKHATASSVLAGWRNREKKGGSHDQGRTSMNVTSRYSGKRPLVAYSGSFDAAKQATERATENSAVQDQKISDVGVDSELRVSEPYPDHFDGNSGLTQDSGASSVVAEWRKREKKGGSFDQGSTSMNSSRTTVIGPRHRDKRSVVTYSGSFDSAKMPSWPRKYEDKGSDMSGGVSPQTTTADKPRWQNSRPGLSLSQSHLESRLRPREGKPTHLHHETSGSDQMKFPSESHDIQDEKKEDAAVTRVTTHLGDHPGIQVLQSATMPIQHDRGNGLANSANVKAEEGVSKDLPTHGLRSGEPLTLRSSIQVQMRMKRSSSEQQKIDAMHRMFIRAGIMGRGQKETISGSDQMKFPSESHDIQDKKKEDAAVTRVTTHLGDHPGIQVLQSSTVPIQHDRGNGLANSANVKAEEGVSKDLPTHGLRSGEPLTLRSSIQVQMRMKRSSSEQQKIDAMHRMFIRAGIMGRGQKQTFSFAHTTSAEYELKKMQEEGDFKPSASDRIHAWKSVDQTQPAMRGKLF